MLNQSARMQEETVLIWPQVTFVSRQDLNSAIVVRLQCKMKMVQLKWLYWPH